MWYCLHVIVARQSDSFLLTYIGGNGLMYFISEHEQMFRDNNYIDLRMHN